MDSVQIEPKKMLRMGAIGVLVLILGVIFFMSWQEVKPGEEGFIFRQYGGGVDKEVAYIEGTQFIAPWNQMITYNILVQSRTYNAQVLDKNGTDIGVDVSVNFHAVINQTAHLHLKHGVKYPESFVDRKARGAIKDVIGRYTYVEAYSTKREILEQEIETILRQDFEGNFVDLDFVEIADINLPENVAIEITNKETQKQRNETAKEKQKEEEYLANAKIAKARGDSALIVSARFKAEAIRLEAEQIGKNPQYIELKKWETWDGKGSPYGTGNVYGSNAVSILKQ